MRKEGNVSMLDSSYDKFFHLYHNKQGLNWLFNEYDLYYDEMINVAQKDYHNLPDFDIVIFFKQTQENWKKFLAQRNRNLDNENEFKNSFILQDAFIEAVNQYCKEKGCKLIIHEQSFTNPKIEAQKIVKKLKQYL
jgi:deoxyadenosine/deoxycytidine kinase